MQVQKISSEFRYTTETFENNLRNVFKKIEQIKCEDYFIGTKVWKANEIINIIWANTSIKDSPIKQMDECLLTLNWLEQIPQIKNDSTIYFKYLNLEFFILNE